MALHWSAKAPGDVVERVWTPKEREEVSSRTITVSTGNATITSRIDGDEVIVTVTGGTANVTQVLAASAVLNGSGETITETIYIPVIATANDFAYTGQDFINYALRKVFGAGRVPAARNADDALERLSDMLAAWKGQGADLGVVLPVATDTTFYVSDAFALAIKNNLIIECADLYPGYEPSPRVVSNAMRGLQQIKSALLSDDRAPVCYF